MKKTFLFLSGLLLLASCSNSDDVTSEVPVPALGGSEELVTLSTEPIYGVPVKLGLGSNVTVTPTKSTGTVGGTSVADNIWRYENIYVLMTTNGTNVKGELLPEMTDYTLSPDEPMLDTEKENGWGYVNVKNAGKQFDGSFFSRPTTETKESSLSHFSPISPFVENPQARYYPPQATCQFYGYYLDDAAKTIDGNGHPAISYNTALDAIKAEFAINGSQDIMIGKAVNYLDPVRYPFFCAATSRQGLNPKITMKHVTTRMTFEIIPGTNDDPATADRQFFITSIGVKCPNEGVLNVAKKDNSDPSVDWTVPGDVETWPILNLQGAAGDNPSFADGKPDVKPFGGAEGQVPVIFNTAQPINLPGALFLCPQKEFEQIQQKYDLIINVKENIGTVANPNWQERSYTNSLTLKEHTAFEAGKSYHVKVYVYRNENIKLSAELEAWEETPDSGLDKVGVDPDLDM